MKAEEAVAPSSGSARGSHLDMRRRLAWTDETTGGICAGGWERQRRARVPRWGKGRGVEEGEGGGACWRLGAAEAGERAEVGQGRGVEKEEGGAPPPPWMRP